MAHCCVAAPPPYGNFSRRKAYFFRECTPGLREASLPGSHPESLHRLNGFTITARSPCSSFFVACGSQWNSILRRRSSFVDHVVPIFSRRKSGCLKRPPWQLLWARGNHWDVKERVHSSTASVQLVCQHGMEQRRCRGTSEVTRGIGRCILGGLLLAVASTCLLLRPKAYAVDAQTLRLTPVLQQCKNALGSLSPKLLQILGVLRDQGLLLSILLGLSAFFSMAETSITTLWPWKVRELAEKETGEVFQMLRQDVARFLTTILIGTTVVNIAATALVTDAATALFGEAGISAATGVMTVVILLLTEITPKSIAVHNATEVARVVMRPIAWLSHVLYPVGRIVTAISVGLLKVLGLKSSSEPFVTEEELKLMLRGAELSGAIEEEEQDMIENVLEIKDTHVREVMTPLVDVVAIDSSATLMDFRNLWVTHQYSRVPVFERRVDNIVGIAYAMDMLDFVEQVDLLQRLTVKRITHKPAYFVPDSMSVWNLLREFRIRKVHMAIVLNEYGGAVGVVTLEDVVEEIVGEIFDENDSKEEIRRKTGYVVQRADGVFDVDANTSIEDLTEALGVKVPEPYHYETVSGFVCEAFGYIPRTGESINLILQKAEDEESDHMEGDSDDHLQHEKYQKFRLEVLAGNARKVASIRFEHLGGSEPKIEAGKVTRIVPRILRHSLDGEQGLEQVADNVDERSYLVGDSDEHSEKQLVTHDAENASHSEDIKYLIAENLDVDNMSDSDVIVTSEQTFIHNQQKGVSSVNEKHSKLKPDHVEITKPTVADTLDKK